MRAVRERGPRSVRRAVRRGICAFEGFLCDFRLPTSNHGGAASDSVSDTPARLKKAAGFAYQLPPWVPTVEPYCQLRFQKGSAPRCSIEFFGLEMEDVYIVLLIVSKVSGIGLSL